MYHYAKKKYPWNHATRSVFCRLRYPLQTRNYSISSFLIPGAQTAHLNGTKANQLFLARNSNFPNIYYLDNASLFCLSLCQTRAQKVAPATLGDSPRSIYQNSIMTSRLSGHFSTFGLIFFVFKSLLGIARQWSGWKFAILTLKPRSHVNTSNVGYCQLTYKIWGHVREHVTGNGVYGRHCFVSKSNLIGLIHLR